MALASSLPFVTTSPSLSLELSRTSHLIMAFPRSCHLIIRNVSNTHKPCLQSYRYFLAQSIPTYRSFRPSFQIISDLHLETPLGAPSYTHFSSPRNLSLLAPNLCLLGDIGLTRDRQHFNFLRDLLIRDTQLNIFYVLGNHECYGTTPQLAEDTFNAFEDACTAEFGPRFFFMQRRRVDLTETITVLGCTLWSRISEPQATVCRRRLADFHPDPRVGIRDRSVEAHNADHARDLGWLNGEISRLTVEEPGRQVVVLTHHCPTVDLRACDPRWGKSGLNVSEAFITDLKGEPCWTAGNVKLWAFGHTHFSCEFMDGEKLIVGSMKGYAYPGGKGNWVIPELVVEAREVGDWKIVHHG